MSHNIRAKEIRLQTQMSWDKCYMQAHNEARIKSLEDFLFSLAGDERIIETIRHTNLPKISKSKEESILASIHQYKMVGYSNTKAFHKATDSYAYLKCYFGQAEILIGMFPNKLAGYSAIEISQILSEKKPFGEPEPRPQAKRVQKSSNSRGCGITTGAELLKFIEQSMEKH